MVEKSQNELVLGVVILITTQVYLAMEWDLKRTIAPD